MVKTFIVFGVWQQWDVKNDLEIFIVDMYSISFWDWEETLKLLFIEVHGVFVFYICIFFNAYIGLINNEIGDAQMQNLQSS